MNTNHEHRVCIGLDVGGYDQCLRSYHIDTAAYRRRTGDGRQGSNEICRYFVILF